MIHYNKGRDPIFRRVYLFMSFTDQTNIVKNYNNNRVEKLISDLDNGVSLLSFSNNLRQDSKQLYAKAPYFLQECICGSSACQIEKDHIIELQDIDNILNQIATADPAFSLKSFQKVVLLANSEENICYIHRCINDKSTKLNNMSYRLFINTFYDIRRLTNQLIYLHKMFEALLTPYFKIHKQYNLTYTNQRKENNEIAYDLHVQSFERNTINNEQEYIFFVNQNGNLCRFVPRHNPNPSYLFGDASVGQPNTTNNNARSLGKTTGSIKNNIHGFTQ